MEDGDGNDASHKKPSAPVSDRVEARLADLLVVNRGGSEELEALDAWRRELRAMRLSRRTGAEAQRTEVLEPVD